MNAQHQTELGSARGSPRTWAGTNWSRLFLSLLAAAHLVDELRFGSIHSWWSWVIAGAAGALVVRRESQIAVTVLTTTKFVYVVTNYPFVNNHDLIYLAVDGIVLVALAASLRRRVDVLSAPGSRRALRTALLLAYGAAAIAKWNHDFFDPINGCGAELTRRAADVSTQLSSTLGRIPDLGWSAIGVAVATIETLIVFLLAVPRFRRMGVLTAVAFHSVMAISPTAIGMAFFACLLLSLTAFLDDDQAASATACAKRWTWPTGTFLARTGTRSFLGMTGALLILWTSELVIGDTKGWLSMLPLVTLMAVVIVCAGLSGSYQMTMSGERLGRGLAIAFVVLLAPVVLAAASPYLGAGTVPSFGMYSNLRTEQRSSNHLFLPSLTIFDTQDRIVRQESELGMTLHETRRKALREGRAVRATDVTTGELVEVAPEPTGIRNWLALKFVRHRPVDVQGVKCRW